MTRDEIFKAIGAELDTAEARFPAFNTAHEGWAVLYEEVMELFDHVRVKQGCRLTHQMLREAIQVASMAIRFAQDICTDDKGNK